MSETESLLTQGFSYSLSTEDPPEEEDMDNPEVVVDEAEEEDGGENIELKDIEANKEEDGDEEEEEQNEEGDDEVFAEKKNGWVKVAAGVTKIATSTIHDDYHVPFSLKRIKTWGLSYLENCHIKIPAQFDIIQTFPAI